MSESLIHVERLGKRYRLSTHQTYHTVRDSISEAIRQAGRFLTRAAPPPGEEREGYLWALRDASFEVKRGEVVGLIGSNGAGKSTLLKLLSRITDPTEGYAEVRGRVGSLLEVGTGFHPELSGRENIYLGAAVLGLRRQEILSRFDAIVDFSGVEKFLETPVKHYSSGMYARLAFAVAAHVDPEILLVDEVLSVGDAAFQEKCLGKMNSVAREGRTVLFVSHNMVAVRNLCQRVIWLTQGGIREDGPAGRVIDHYIETVREGFAQDSRNGDRLVIECVVLRNGRGEATLEFRPGEELVMEIHFRANERIELPNLFLWVTGRHGAVFIASMLLDGRRPEALEGVGVLSCRFPSIPLIPQLYSIHFGARTTDAHTVLTRNRDVAFFSVIGPLVEAGLLGNPGEALLADTCSVVIPYEWSFPGGITIKVALSPRTVMEAVPLQEGDVAGVIER